MTINLPFEIGQKVWTLSDDDKAVEMTIRDISLSISEDETLNYTNYYSAPVYEKNVMCRKENQLFLSREELKNSIFGSID